MDVSETKRIIILGKTGAGKSSLANTIFGEQLFSINPSYLSLTRESQAETRSVNGRSITLIDTPSFFAADRSEEELKPEILRSITECAPGPHAFLIVLKVERFTMVEQAVINKIQQYFSDEVFRYATVVFTHGDNLPEGLTVQDFVQMNRSLSDLVEKCGGRCHVFDNKYWRGNQQDEYRSNQFQVEELLKTIEKMVDDNNGRWYTNEMLQQVERAIQQEEENIRRSSGNTSDKKNKEKVEVGFLKRLWIKLAGSKTKRIVILGKSGAGKSSLANTIFGKDVFEIDHSFSSGTSKCQAQSVSVNGSRITLIDTPGFFDTRKSEEEMRPEIVRCITQCAPGPHAFLIVLKLENYTDQEQDVINKIQQYFSEEAFRYATVLFTHGDQLPAGLTIEDLVRRNKSVSDLVKRCGGRCHVIDNKYWKDTQDEYRNNQIQVEELLKTINKMVEDNKGDCYTNEMLQEVEKIRKQQEADVRPPAGAMTDDPSDAPSDASSDDRLYQEVLIRLAGVGTGALLGALLGVGVMVGTVVIVLKTIVPVIPLAKKAYKALATTGETAEGGGASAAGDLKRIAATGTVAGAVRSGGIAAVSGEAGGAAATSGGTVAVPAEVGGAAATSGGTAAAAITAVKVSAVGGALIGGIAGYVVAEGAETPQEAAKRAAVAVKDGALFVLDAVNDTMEKLTSSK